MLEALKDAAEYFHIDELLGLLKNRKVISYLLFYIHTSLIAFSYDFIVTTSL